MKKQMAIARKHAKKLAGAGVLLLLLLVLITVPNRSGRSGQTKSSLLSSLGRNPLDVSLNIRPAAKVRAGYAMSIGEESTIILTLNPKKPLKNVSAMIELPDGLALVSGERVYTGDVSGEIKLMARVRASRVGDWTVKSNVAVLNENAVAGDPPKIRVCVNVVKEDAKRACSSV